MHHADDIALGAALAVMREAGVQSRAYVDETGVEILWRPKPSQMDPTIRALVKEHAAALACILAPLEPYPLQPRAFWSMAEGVSQCVGCGRSTVWIDPLGQPRHQQCGWLGQQAVIAAASHQKRLWHQKNQKK
jgi:hypothetical protein